MYSSMMATKRGRPRKSRGQARDELLIVRLGSAEKESFVAAAGFAGQDLSVWVRERLRQSARKELEELGQPVAFLGQANSKNGQRQSPPNGAGASKPQRE